MKLEDLRKSATEMSDDELDAEILAIRKDRRLAGRKEKKAVGKKAQKDLNKIADFLSGLEE